MPTITLEADTHVVHYTDDSELRAQDRSEKLQAIGSFLGELAQDGHRAVLHIHADDDVGGIRVDDVGEAATVDDKLKYRWRVQRGTSDSSHAAVILGTELFLTSHGKKPFLPEGEERCKNPHGYAKLRLMRTIGHSGGAIQREKKKIEAEEIEFTGTTSGLE
jgi:hypothetical protein